MVGKGEVMPKFEVTAPDGKTLEVEGPEGATQEQALAYAKSQYKPPETSGAMDFFKSIPRGAVQGLVGTAEYLKEGLTPRIGGMDIKGMGEATARDVGAVESVTGALPQPQGTAGEFGRTLGEFLGSPLSYLGPGGLATKALTAAGGALGSEAATQVAKSAELGPTGESLAGLGGAMVGARAPHMAARAVTPFPISPERQAMVGTLQKEGVQPTAGQISGRRALKYAESVLGEAPGAGGTTEATNERVLQQFTRAALTRVGETADRATPEVVDRAFGRIGGQFDALASRNPAQLDPQFVQDLFAAQHEYEQLVPATMRKPIVENTINDVLARLAQSRTMSGEQYKVLRSRIDKARRGARGDPELNGTLADIKEALDGVMERSIAANNSADLGAWKEVRNQFRNMLVIEGASTGAGETAASGLVSPAKLRQGVVSQGRRAYARGQGDFADLARAGEAVLSPLPQSGTAPRLFTQAIPAAAGAALGHGAGFGDLGPAIAGAMAPGVAGRALMSKPAQAYLSNQAFANLLKRMGRPIDASIRALLTKAATQGGENAR